MAPGTQGETETDEIGAALEDTFRSRAVEQEGNNCRRKVRRARRASVAAGDPHVTVFKGIPYAEAPVGENRWRPPIPKGKWEGVFDAVRFGNVCPQGIPQPGTFYHKEFFSAQALETHSEDCLQLNVWTPAETAEEKLPVLVFIHGGGFQTNYSFPPQFDGEEMARKGVVAVTINYRVGIFGFLAHPDLSRESDRGISGNYGLMDQICALQWVRDNIHAFGGDPEQITISGGSAGANSVLLLSVIEQTRGWFKGGIMQSGPLLEDNFTLAQGEVLGKGMLDRYGLHSIEEARKVDASVLCQYGPDLDRGEPPFLQPYVDGYLLKDSVIDCVRNHGLDDHTTYIVGCAKDEARSMRNRFRATPESLDKKLQDCYGPYSKEYRDAVRYGTPEEAFQFQLDHGFTEDMYVYSLAFCLMHGAETKKPVYMYHFERPLPGDDNGSFHACEHWYVFKTLNRCWRPFQGVDYELSDRIVGYWSNFIKHQDPNGGDLPQWEPFTGAAPRYMVLDTGTRMERAPIGPAVKARLKYYCGEQAVPEG